MPKKCIICGDPALFVVKGTSDYYCEKDAQECFGDVALLQSVEQQAQQLKEQLRTQIDELAQDIGQLESHKP